MQEGGNGELALRGERASVWGNREVLEMDSGGESRAQHIGKVLNVTELSPKNGWKGDFCVLHQDQKKKKKSKSPILTPLRESICGEGARRAR